VGVKALTLIQPWAGLIATGVKLVENRTWHPPGKLNGQRFAIHAGAKVDRETIEDLLEDDLDEHPLWRVKSAVLAVATLSFVVVQGAVNPSFKVDRLPKDQLRWFNGPIGFVLADVVAIDPVPCKGALGFWTLTDDVEAMVRAQMEAA
jgi:hypothetical protein